MARFPNIFSDPGGPLGTWAWPINHNEEEESTRSLAIEHTANTAQGVGQPNAAGTGLVRQQGDPQPLTLRYSGSIMRREHFVEMLKWTEACRTRTIHFTDFAGEKYEVLITSFQPRRVRVMKNRGGQAGTPESLYYWNYSIEMEVVTFIDGVYSEAGVTP